MPSVNLPVFSIIIPVYNGASVIERCLDSIIVQTHPQFEVIIVDDGSKDDTGKICRNYSNNHNRITYHRQENKGVSAARNKGLELAKNEFILFVDADDFLEPDYLEQFCTEITATGKSEDVFIIQNFTAHLHTEDGKIESVVWCQFIYGSYTQEQLFKNLLRLKWPYYSVPFAKLFRLSVIRKHHLHFVEGMSFKEDLIFLMEYLKYVPKVRFTESVKYLYTIDKSKPTLSTITASFESESLFFQHFKRLTEYYTGKYELDEETKQFFYRAVYEGFFRSINSCMYTYKVPMPTKQRLTNLRMMATKEHLAGLKVSGVIDNKTKLIGLTLLKFRMYRLYDFLNVMRYK